MRELTPKQEAFSQYVADGLTQSEAYRRAYKNGKATVIAVKAHEEAKKTHVAARIAGLKAEAAAVKGLSRVEKRHILQQIAVDRDADARTRIDAVKTDNLMTGDNKPIKLEGEITLGSILREIAPTTGLPSQDKPR